MKKIILTIIILLIGVNVQSADGDGGYAGTFLQVPIGARAAGMGGAYISIANDGAGLFYNPAGIANIKQNLFATSYRAMQFDRKLGYVAFMIPTQGNSAIGINWLYGGSGAVEARNTDGDRLGYDLEMHSHSISVVFAKRFEDFLSVGFSGAYIYNKFAEMSSFSIKIDIGVVVYLSKFIDREKRDLMPIQDIQAGLVVRNIASENRWNNENFYYKYSVNTFGSQQNDPFPLEIGLGLSARFFDRRLLSSVDLLKNEFQAVELHLGSEYFITPQFALRGGYSDNSITAGFGYVFSLGKQALAVDYAFSNEKVDEGSEHLFSIDWLF